jgi:L-cysteine:1D-myo-inositol 2-amino-2-deoxy-alpha-D-glucopyranoside ligase
LSQHYRSSFEWQDDLLDAAESRLAQWRKAGEGTGAVDAVRAHLDDDLDTPSALVTIDEAASRGEGVSAAAALLGVGCLPAG